ncbi:hypothetical protein PRK78_003918 [Emydomyces testavorans]|uniref:Uncharacterized protein n=1 Tax=Emydomyces testavorans TaxID=2070801 RepID=A0AAF0II45_9EURO|nr:hypothetical protein PRK78_003918 [Emydomyces testavorans]
MSYTEMYMLAFVPNSGDLPSIGSVAENFARTEDTSFFDFITSSPEAESIRATFGEATYYSYVEQQLEIRNEKLAESQEHENHSRKHKFSATDNDTDGHSGIFESNRTTSLKSWTI